MATTALAEEALPIKVDAEIGAKGGEPHLVVKVVNLTAGEVIVRKDLVRGARWRTRVLAENERSPSFHFSFWEGRTRCGWGGSQTPAQFIRKQLEIPDNVVPLNPGAAYVFSVPFEQAFAAAGLKDRKDLQMVAQLILEDVILSSPGADDREALRLYNALFRAPPFIFRDGEWKRY